MNPKSILLPICAQAILTLVVWIWMYYLRIGTILRSRIKIQKLENESFATNLLKDVVNPSDNLENLFELPVLFYVVCLALYVTNMADATYLNMAWAFVIFRVLHSLVHCAYNNINHRFTMYIFSSIALWAMWIRLTYQLMKLAS